MIIKIMGKLIIYIVLLIFVVASVLFLINYKEIRLDTEFDDDNILLSIILALNSLWGFVACVIFIFAIINLSFSIVDPKSSINLTKTDYILAIMSYISVYIGFEFIRYLEYLTDRKKRTFKLSLAKDYGEYKMLGNRLIEIEYNDKHEKVDEEGYVLLYNMHRNLHSKSSGYFGENYTRCKIKDFKIRSGYRPDYLVCDAEIVIEDILKYNFLGTW